MFGHTGGVIWADLPEHNFERESKAESGFIKNFKVKRKIKSPTALVRHIYPSITLKGGVKAKSGFIKNLKGQRAKSPTTIRFKTLIPLRQTNAAGGFRFYFYKL